jgi:hypothetical protein
MLLTLFIRLPLAERYTTLLGISWGDFRLLMTLSLMLLLHRP